VSDAVSPILTSASPLYCDVATGHLEQASRKDLEEGLYDTVSLIKSTAKRTWDNSPETSAEWRAAGELWGIHREYA